MGVRKRQRDRQVVREEVLRPSRHLGYDRDQLGLYFLQREAFELAESQFRRAVWLNPFEASFQEHWVVSLARLGRMEEARDVLLKLLERFPEDEAAIQIWRRYWPEESPPGHAAQRGAEKPSCAS